MQSDGNSFGGDVVLDNVNTLSSFEDSILDQMHEKQMFSCLHFEDFKFLKKLKKMHI